MRVRPPHRSPHPSPDRRSPVLSSLTFSAHAALRAPASAQASRFGNPTDLARSMTQAVLAGVVGHHEERHASWLPKMSFRHRAQDIAPDALLAQIDARRSDHSRPIDVAVMVHGLFVDEQNWTLGPEPFADAVEPMFGWTPLLVRYNAGRHISQNGAALAALLGDLRDAWGPRLGRIQVVGHSMGGLVSRAALGTLERTQSPVLDHIDRLFLLGVPNHGAELERLGHSVEVALGHTLRLPRQGLSLFRRSRPVGPSGLVSDTLRDVVDGIMQRAATTAAIPLQSARSLVQMRSDGIRDVRYGYMQESEWRLCAQWNDRLWVSHRRPLVPPASVATYAIAGSLVPVTNPRPSRLRNDGLVSVASAAGKGGTFDDLQVVEQERFAEFPMLVHQLLPSSARVRAQMREWIVRDHGVTK